MKVYVAASYPRKQEAKTLALIIASHGHTITSDWFNLDEGYNDDGARKCESERAMNYRLQRAAVKDVKQVVECDVIICFTDGESQSTHGGRHSELGIAIGLDKKCFIIGPKEQVMHWLPRVHKFDDLDSFLRTGVNLLQDGGDTCEQ